DEALLGRQSVDPALDVEQGVDALHGLEGDRIDRLSALASRFPACGVLDIRKFEELAPCMGEAASFEHGAGAAAGSVELTIAAIGIGLEDTGPGSEVGLRMLSAPIARVVEQGRRRCRSGERPVVADIGP